MFQGMTQSIEQFHSRLFSQQENSQLMAALRRLSQVENSRQITATAAALDGWFVWYDHAEAPTAAT